MDFELCVYENEWNKMYELAKSYYEFYNHLRVPSTFITKNGYEPCDEGFKLGLWISSQRQIYKGKKRGNISYEKIELLEKIGMEWFTSLTDEKLQCEVITESNIARKRKELENRLYSLLCCYERESVTFNSLDKKNICEINSDFLNSLGTIKKLTLKK